MIGIYKITSPNNRVYIGQTLDWERRLKEYNHIKYSKKQVKLHYSFNKYSISNHIFEFIEQCEINQLNERERYWQDFYNCLHHGLNCRLTTSKDKSGFISETTKQNMRGKIRTGIVKANISNSLVEYYKNNPHPIKGFKRGTCNNKLTKEQVLEIRQLLIDGHIIVDIAKIYNVSKPTIQQIKEGKTWQSLGNFKLVTRQSRISPDIINELYIMFSNHNSVKEIQFKLHICISTIAKYRKLWKQLKKLD